MPKQPPFTKMIEACQYVEFISSAPLNVAKHLQTILMINLLPAGLEDIKKSLKKSSFAGHSVKKIRHLLAAHF